MHLVPFFPHWSIITLVCCRNPPSITTGFTPLPLTEDNPLIRANDTCMRFIHHTSEYHHQCYAVSGSTCAMYTNGFYVHLLMQHLYDSAQIIFSPYSFPSGEQQDSHQLNSPFLSSAALPPPPSSSSRSDDKWLSQVEILTHAPPSRRLWMGPQFSFKTYQSSGKTSSSSAVTCLIKTPSPPNTIIYSGSLTSSGGLTHLQPHHTTTTTTPARTIGSAESTCTDNAAILSLTDNAAVLSLSAENPLFSEPSDLQSLNLKPFDTAQVQEGQDTGRPLQIILFFILIFLLRLPPTH